MTALTFHGPRGESIARDVPAGLTLVKVANWTGVHTLRADCGGDLTCGTCHVYVAWPDLAAPTPDEVAMLGLVERRRADSRLACQVRVPATTAPLAVEIPE